ncbi:hypothetical protein LCGC14_1517340 [marine sediment metagenome]|uniref:Uncharacterized protein n=1 Tax=marine sediment metagenome TaxID=412755 RepID=A0A0F9IZP0_9ZZZZ
MEIDIKEQEAKLRVEAQEIGAQLAAIQENMVKLEQAQQILVNKAMKNQGALDLLKSLNGDE